MTVPLSSAPPLLQSQPGAAGHGQHEPGGQGFPLTPPTNGDGHGLRLHHQQPQPQQQAHYIDGGPPGMQPSGGLRQPQPQPLPQAQLLPQPQYLGDMMTPGNSHGSPLTASAGSPEHPSRTRFAIFQRRAGAPPVPRPGAPPQQSPQQAFPPPPGRPYGSTGAYPAGGYPEGPPPGPRDAQPLQELVGGNWIFVVFLPYFVATALQDTHLRYGLIAATGGSGLVLLLGLGVWTLNLRKVFPHILEVIMFVTFAVQLGVSYHSDSYRDEVTRTYNFTTHSALAGTCLLSMLAGYPAGYQHAQELVHRLYMVHPEVQRVGMYTTAVLIASLVSSCLLYLVPLCKGHAHDHWHVLNIIFRLIYPPVATFLALLFVRYFPDAYLPNLAVIHGLNKKPTSRLPAYLTDLLSMKPPSILDATMYQSTADAATKVREGWAMTPRAASPARTPRYGPGGTMLSGHMPPASAPGMVVPGHQFPVGYEPEGYPYPRQDPHQQMYTYYAAGPPSPPPLAVFALYGDHHHPNHHSSGGASHPHDPRYGLPVGNPLMAAGPSAMHMGHPSRAAPYGIAPYGVASYGAPYGGPQQHYGPKPFGGQGRLANAINNFRGRRSTVEDYPNPNPYAHQRPGNGHPNLYPPGRNYASAGGAGPYGVNMPLAELAAGGGGQRQLNHEHYQPPLPYPDRNRNHNNGLYDDPDTDPNFGGGGGGGLRPLAGGRQDRPYGGGGLADEYGYGRPSQPVAALQQPYGNPVRHTSEGGFGLGAELRGPSPPPPPLQRPLPPSQWGPGAVQPVGGGGLHDSRGRQMSSEGGGGGFGLGAEINNNPSRSAAGLPATLPPSGLYDAPPPAHRPPLASSGGGQFGLDAEVGSVPPAPLSLGLPQRLPPSRLGPAPAHRPLPRPQSGLAPRPRDSSGGGGFGLDAEVGAGGGGGVGGGLNVGGLLPPPGGLGGLGRGPSPLPPPGALLGPSRNSGGGGGFGLDAEVDGGGF